MSAPTRKLAAILAADVAGYSKLMGEDETGTLDALRKLRQDLFQPTVTEHRGEVVKSMGDGWLVEFASVVDAVNCALQVQENLANHELIKLRIGIHIGDIVHEDEDIYGDGVNIAARLQEISEPGGVALSGRARDFLDGKLANGFRDTGEKQLKNIAETVRVFVFGDDETGQTPRGDAPLPLPDKPSIAVLPFDNMSGDPEQEFFVDGVVEDILTTLAKIEHLFVIARNSSFTYKGKAVDVRSAGRELGVRYIVEGSVRKAGNRVRVTAQLVDTLDGHHLWADRFDGDLDDVFDLQDRITEEIVTALEVKLTEGEQVRIWRKRSGSPRAYEHLVRARRLFHEFSRDTNRRAIAEAEQAIEINPEFWQAWIMLGYANNQAARFGWSDNPERSVEIAENCVKRVFAGDPSIPDAHSVAGGIALAKRDYDGAIEAGRRGIELGPNNADCHHGFAMIQCFAGDHRAAIDLEQQALRLNPLSPVNSLVELGRAYFHLGRYGEATEVLRQVLERQPRWLAGHTLLLATCVASGDEAEARRQQGEILRLNPKFSIARYIRLLPYRNEADLNKLVDALRQGGLPEE